MPEASLTVDAPVRAPGVALDASQRAVLDLPGTASAVVLGVAGSGKTTTLVELVAERLAAGLDPARLLVVAGSRQAATA
ncbi:UvrD-helicase domain-containing protein, partial [Agrococcus sp. HG114]|uniref:UvrD-helicase domain-containing protein n=1 Tax=Agrococcus sp. HG114 TaxID=2969757 RepID=UPI00215A5F53